MATIEQTAHSDDTRLDRKAVAAVVLGNALEFYDFITYSFFAKQIGDAFFPAGGTPTASLLSSLLVFWIGFVTRPVGAVLLGAFGDRAGRKPAMLVTISMMAAGMLILAFTPSFKTIGWAAPAIVVVGRLIQGFALGGEVGPSTAYLIEAAPARSRALMASWQLASQGLAQLFAGILGIALAFSLSMEAMRAWGWRIPFVVGFLIVPVGLVIRNHLPETAESDKPSSSGEVLTTLSQGHARLLLLGFLMIMASTIATYAGIYMPTYAQDTLGLSLKISSFVTIALGVTSVAFSLAGGWLADRLGRRPLMLWPRLAVALVAVPIFWWVVHAPAAASIVGVTVLVSILTNLASAGSIVGIPEALPRAVRSTGLSIAYALAVTVFGGSTQWVLTKLIVVTGDKLAPAYYLAATGMIGALAALMMPETKGKPLD